MDCRLPSIVEIILHNVSCDFVMKLVGGKTEPYFIPFFFLFFFLNLQQWISLSTVEKRLHVA